jgi:hypothetical protein
MVDFYQNNLTKKPSLKDRVIAKFKYDSFSFVVVRAWKEAVKKQNDKNKNSNNIRRRNKFIEKNIDKP